MESFSQVWNSICSYCKETGNLSDIAYDTWISQITPLSIDFEAGTVTLQVPNEFHRQLLIKSYHDLFQNAFVAVLGSSFDIRYVLSQEEKTEKNTVPNLLKNDYEFTFDTFIVGSSNKLAHAAALAVVDKPGTAYNPLFIYGNSGLGKTHLLYAISKAIQDNNPEARIIYIKGDDFTNELIESIRLGNTPLFRQKYRNADVLLVDDIQFIAGKERTQEEFFHTFNTLFEAKKQIVLTSDRTPKDIATLEDRLQTRFEWGLLVDIQPPDIETRIAIIRRKAENLQFDLPDDVTNYIAEHLKNNIRQLEGAVKSLQAQKQLTGISPNIVSAQKIISSVISNNQSPQKMLDKILEEVSRTYNISVEDLCSSKQHANIAFARKVAFYVARETTTLSLSDIGDRIGNKKHSTVIYNIQQLEKQMQTDPKVRNTVNDILKNIQD